MASQGEGDEGSGKGQVEKPAVSSGNEDGGSVELEAKDIRARYYDHDDALRAERLAAVDGEASGFLSPVGVRPTGYEQLTPAQLRAVHRDVEEREGWSETQADVFRGILRLGKPVPRRSGRIL